MFPWEENPGFPQTSLTPSQLSYASTAYTEKHHIAKNGLGLGLTGSGSEQYKTGSENEWMDKTFTAFGKKRDHLQTVSKIWIKPFCFHGCYQFDQFVNCFRGAAHTPIFLIHWICGSFSQISQSESSFPTLKLLQMMRKNTDHTKPSQ